MNKTARHYKANGPPSVNDERYGVVHIGLMKAGYKTMLPSTRNSPEGQANLATKTACSILLHSEGVDASVQDFMNVVSGMKTLEVPSFSELRNDGAKDGHYQGHYSSAAGSETLILHTSGSTGLPKPIRLTNGSLSVIGTLNSLPCPDGRITNGRAVFAQGEPLFVMTPFFHTMGALMMMRSILCRSPLVRLPTGKPPNAELVTTVLKQTTPTAGIFAPALLEQIVDTADGLESLSRLKYVFFGGAPLATDTGDKIRKMTTLVSVIGSTEAGVIASVLPADQEDWEYFEWAPEAGVHMEPEAHGLYELVIKPAEARAQAIFYTFPNIAEWRTSDLWQQHPSKTNLWRYKGRKDDVIVFSNGEKLNPVGFEKTVESHPKVQGAVVVGQGKFQSGLLIEPAWDVVREYDPSTLLDELWSAIDRANADMPAHGRVWKSKIAFAKKDKPFKRAPKGSIVRQQTIKLYGREIKAIYSNEAEDADVGKLPADADLTTATSFLRKTLKRKGMPVPGDAPDDADIFAYGLDSLQVLALSSVLNHARGKGDAVTPRDIYQHSTIEGLARLLVGDAGLAADDRREDVMEEMLAKYTHDLPTPSVASAVKKPAKHTVVLTGSTGSLGNSILEELIASPQVKQVFCLNRSGDAKSRQSSAFASRGVEAEFSKVTFLHTDFGKEKFGLSSHDYRQLLDTVTTFIHNAWAVDFNKSLRTYEAVHIAGTRRCVDFSHESKYGAHVIFISSIASVGNWRAKHPSSRFVPEESFHDHELPVPQGYGESKHVSSLILTAAAEKSEVPSTVVRCGQLAGPKERGQMWNKHEWLPSIVLTSKSMGSLPEKLGNQDTIDWVPIDLAAKSVVEISQTRTNQVWEKTGPKTSVSHVVNPSTVSWKSLLPSIKQALEKQTGVAQRTVPYKEWLEELSATPRTTEAAEERPGIKLLDFYESLVPEGGGLPRLATDQTAKLSQAIATMGAIDAALMIKWIEQWSN